MQLPEPLDGSSTTRRGAALNIVLTAYVRFGNALAWHALEVARGLHAAGHNVLLFCKKGSPLARWAEGSPFAVDALLSLDNPNAGTLLRQWQHFRKAIHDFHPDILNPHCPPGHSHLAILRSLDHSRIPLIRTVADPRPPSGNPFNSFLHRKFTDGMLFTTASSLRRYERFVNLRRMKHEVILPGFRADDFVHIAEHGGYRARFGLNPGQLLIGIIARMSPEKGQEVLLKALSLLSSEERSRLFCVVAGEDTRERTQADLRALARQIGVEENVTFLERLDDVRPLMSELDIGLVTSTRSEAICRVALEYMSFGIPVIASDVNILPEVVRNTENGMTFPNHSSDSLAGILRQLMADADLRQRLAVRGYEMVRSEFSLLRETERILSFYQNAIAALHRRHA